jgi:hypothetical protein
MRDSRNSADQIALNGSISALLLSGTKTIGLFDT